TSNTWSDDDPLILHVPETSKRKKDKKPDTSNTWSDDDPLILHVPETSKRKKPGRKEPVKSTIVARASVNDTSNTWSDDDPLILHVPETSKRKKHKKPDTSNTWSDDDPLILHVPETSKRKKPGRKEPVKSTIVARASVNDTSNTWSDDDPLILHVPETSKRKKHKKPAGRKEPVKSTIVARASVNDTSNTWSDDDPLILHVPETSKRKKPGRKEPVKSTIVARASVNDTSNTWSDDDPLILHVPETSKRKKPGRKEPVKSTIVARASVNDTSNTWSDDDPLILHVPETSKRKKHQKPAGRKEPVKSTIVAPLKNKKIQKNFDGNVKLQHLPIKQIPLVDKVKNFDGNVKLQHLHILFTSLIPYVKRILEEQKVELLMEANALGVQVSSLTIKKSMAIDERLSCNFCSTSLVGVYRGCSKCNKYDVCLACCRDFRNNKPLNKVAEFGKCGNFENYWHVRSNITCSKWRIENDKILCPTCDNSVLELTDNLENDRFSNLEARANSANSKIETNNLTDSKSQQLDESFGERLKAASRESGDDFLYNPLSKDVYEKDDLMCFRQHWMKGHPVIFRDVLKQSSGLSWEPMVIFRACKEYLKWKPIRSLKGCKHVINCLGGCVVSSFL
ncbi:lysine-specific demethylase JMJ25-like protein, partial [Tanacetum coccineum]